MKQNIENFEGGNPNQYTKEYYEKLDYTRIFGEYHKETEAKIKKRMGVEDDGVPEEERERRIKLIKSVIKEKGLDPFGQIK